MELVSCLNLPALAELGVGCAGGLPVPRDFCLAAGVTLPRDKAAGVPGFPEEKERVEPPEACVL